MVVKYKVGTKVMLIDQSRFPEYYTKGKVFTVISINNRAKVRADKLVGVLPADGRYFKLANIIYLGGE